MTMGGVGVRAGFKRATAQLNVWQHFRYWKTQKLSKSAYTLPDIPTCLKNTSLYSHISSCEMIFKDTDTK